MKKKSDDLDVTICSWARVQLVRCGGQEPGEKRFEVIEPDHVAVFRSLHFYRPGYLALKYFVGHALAEIERRKEDVCFGK